MYSLVVWTYGANTLHLVHVLNIRRVHKLDHFSVKCAGDKNLLSFEDQRVLDGDFVTNIIVGNHTFTHMRHLFWPASKNSCSEFCHYGIFHQGLHDSL